MVLKKRQREKQHSFICRSDECNDSDSRNGKKYVIIIPKLDMMSSLSTKTSIHSALQSCLYDCNYIIPTVLLIKNPNTKFQTKLNLVDLFQEHWNNIFVFFFSFCTLVIVTFY